MSILNEFRALQQALKRQQERLESLQNNEQLSRDLAFEQKLLTLLKRHNMDIQQLLGFIPGSASSRPAVCEPPATYKTDKARKAGKPRSRP